MPGNKRSCSSSGLRPCKKMRIDVDEEKLLLRRQKARKDFGIYIYHLRNKLVDDGVNKEDIDAQVRELRLRRQKYCKEQQARKELAERCTRIMEGKRKWCAKNPNQKLDDPTILSQVEELRKMFRTGVVATTCGKSWRESSDFCNEMINTMRRCRLGTLGEYVLRDVDLVADAKIN